MWLKLIPYPFPYDRNYNGTWSLVSQEKEMKLFQSHLDDLHEINKENEFRITVQEY